MSMDHRGGAVMRRRCECVRMARFDVAVLARLEYQELQL